MNLQLSNKIKLFCKHNNYPLKDISNICYIYPRSNRTFREATKDGNYHFYLNDEMKFINECDFMNESIIISTCYLPIISIDTKFSTTSNNYVFTSIDNNVSNLWIYLYLNAYIEDVRKCYVDNLLNKNKLMSFKIPIPPKDIQEMFELNYFFNYLEYININSFEINKNKEEIIC